MRRLLEDPNLSSFERELLERDAPLTMPKGLEARVLEAVTATTLGSGVLGAGAKGSLAPPALLPGKALAVSLKGWFVTSLWLKVGAAVIVSGSVAAVGIRHFGPDARGGTQAKSAPSMMNGGVAGSGLEAQRSDDGALLAKPAIEAAGAETARVEPIDVSALPSVKPAARAGDLRPTILDNHRNELGSESKASKTQEDLPSEVSGNPPASSAMSALLLAEARLLGSARSALSRHDYARAESDLREASAYTAMGEERTLLLVELLRATGRGEEGDRILREFVAAHPKSVHGRVK